MRALVATGDSKRPLEFRDVPEPEPNARSAVIEVAHVSVNRGELHRLTAAADGWRPGWDIAGTVVADSEEGSGLQVGDRVVALADGGGWAERASILTDNLTVVPPQVDLRVAATLPTAGITALRTLRRGGLLLGKKVLVTGATGGVGTFAVSLAHLSGASVTALSSDRERCRQIFSEYPVEIISDIGDAHRGSYDLILESVGGETLSHAMEAVCPGGSVVTFGNSSKQRTDFLVNDFYTQDRARLEAYFLFGDIRSDPVRRDLSVLASLVDQGRLRPALSTEASWTDWDEALRSLADRTLDGKAVLTVCSTAA